MIVELTLRDLPEILEFERSTFPAGLQADRLLYERRLALGHIMLGYRKERLAGLISFSYGVFDAAYPDRLPDNFYAWSTQPVPEVWDTQFIYNLGVAPDARGTSVLRTLVRAALKRATDDGCQQVLAEGPLPSFAGNGRVQASPAVRDTLNAVALGESVELASLFADPHLALYKKLCQCKILRVMPNFLPTDAASGGFRAMLFAPLSSADNPVPPVVA